MMITTVSEWRRHLLREAVASCPDFELSNEVTEFVGKYNTDEEFLRAGGLPVEMLDRLAFGFADSDIKTITPDKIKIKWKLDWANVKQEVRDSGLTPKAWSSKVNLSEPIEVSYKNGNFWLEDGHHRLFAAKTLGKTLNVDLTIEENPVNKLANGLGYDQLMRCIFVKVKSSGITERSSYTVPDATRQLFIDINRKAAEERNIRTDGDFIFLYHGTSRQNMNKIVNSGMLKAGTWLTPDLDEANRYAYTKGSSPVVDTFAVYMGSLAYNGYFNTQEDLILKDGHYAPKNYKPAVSNESADQELEDAEFKTLSDSLSAYFLDNYSQDDLKNIVGYKSRIGDDKGNSPIKLYRGIFFNNITPEQSNKLISGGVFTDNNISWTKSLHVAKIFAKGSNIYDETDPDEMTLSTGQVGIILEHTFNPDDVLIDVNYAVENSVYYEINDSMDDEYEVLVYPKNNSYKILKIYR